MRLLKTALLSTTLLISATFGSEVISGGDAQTIASTLTDAELFTNSLQEIRGEYAEYLDVLTIITKKVELETVVPTEDGPFLDTLGALSKGVNALLKSKTSLATELEAANARVAALETEMTEIRSLAANAKAQKSEAAVSYTGFKFRAMNSNRTQADALAGNESPSEDEDDFNTLPLLPVSVEGSPARGVDDLPLVAVSVEGSPARGVDDLPLVAVSVEGSPARGVAGLPFVAGSVEGESTVAATSTDEANAGQQTTEAATSAVTVADEDESKAAAANAEKIKSLKEKLTAAQEIVAGKKPTEWQGPVPTGKERAKFALYNTKQKEIAAYKTAPAEIKALKAEIKALEAQKAQ